jgi:membrane protease YdiL (CAAX protease family)
MRKYFELLTIPVAILLLVLWNLFAGGVKLHQFTWEKVGKVFEAFLLFLIALGFIRIVFIVLFKEAYRWFDIDFKEFKESWKNTKDSEKLFYALGLFYVLSDLYKVIFSSL